MRHLDQQIAAFDDRLRGEIQLSRAESSKVATLVAADVRFLPQAAKTEIEAASPVPLSARYEELVAFQGWMDLVASRPSHAAVVRAQVIVQNYVCFLYLKDTCFEIIARYLDPASVAARCARYLSKGRVRDFRNAFSHANWCYRADFTGLEAWVLEDARDRQGPMRRFEVSQEDLNFWQALARGVGYAVYEQLGV